MTGAPHTEETSVASSESSTEVMPTPLAPDEPPAEGAYGSIDYTYKKKSNKAKGIIAIVVAVVVMFGLGLLVGHFLPGQSNEPAADSAPGDARIVLSEERVQSNLEAIEMTAPDVSRYSFISSTENLVGPRFSDVVIGDAETLGSGASAKTMRTATALATFRNKSVVVTVPVSLSYEFDPEKETWIQGELVTGQQTAQSISAPNAAAIVADLPTMLNQSYPDVANLFVDAATKTTPNLTAEGGSIAVGLTKETEVEGKKYFNSVDVLINVVWNEDYGWEPSIASVGEVVSTLVDGETEEPEEAEEVEGDEEVVVNNSGRDHYALTCTNGDLVELPGTIVSVNGTLQLRLDYLLTLSMDGATWDLNDIGISFSREDGGESLVGSHVTVMGTLSTSYASGGAPVGIRAESVS